MKFQSSIRIYVTATMLLLSIMLTNSTASPQFTFINNTGSNFMVSLETDIASRWIPLNRDTPQRKVDLNCGYYADKPVVTFPAIKAPNGEVAVCGYEICNKNDNWNIIISNDGSHYYRYQATINGAPVDCSNLLDVNYDVVTQ